MQLSVMLIVIACLLFPVLSQAAPYGNGTYGSGNYNTGPVAATVTTSTSSDSGPDPVTSADNTITTSQSKQTTATGVPQIIAQTGQRITLTSTPVDVDRLQSLQLRVLGKNYFFVDPDDDGIYTLSLTFDNSGTYAYALTADWGITTRTEHGFFIVRDARNVFPLSELNQLFRSVFNRTPTVEEWQYWAGRREDKPTRTAFIGALQFHQLQGRTIGSIPTSGRIELLQLNNMFRSVYDRDPTQTEWSYWAQRLKDKFQYQPFLGALQWHLLFGITH